MPIHLRTPCSVLLLALTAFACSDDESKSCGANAAGYMPVITAADFPDPTKIDNPFFPLAPGWVGVYENSNGNVLTSTVTGETRVVNGVTCVVVHDLEKLADGTVEEDTFDWYAQDKDGNVWYFGEDTKAYSGSKVSTEGSWEAGVACAQPGIVMKAAPVVGDRYRQEYLEGEAEDEAEVVSLSESVEVTYGKFTGCLKTRDFTALDPTNEENKTYCKGVGFVLGVDVVKTGTGDREELASINGATGDGGAADGGAPADGGSDS